MRTEKGLVVLVAITVAFAAFGAASASADERPEERAATAAPVAAQSSVDGGASDGGGTSAGDGASNVDATAAGEPRPAEAVARPDGGAAPEGALAGRSDAGTKPPTVDGTGAHSPATAKPPSGDPNALPWDDRLAFGIRAEYAFPVGATTGGVPISDVVSGAFLVGGEIGYLVAPRWTLLAYFFYGFPQVSYSANATCTSDPDNDCSAGLIRAGVAANYHFSAEKRFDPWVGFGVGYELLTVTAVDDSSGDENGANSLNGLEVSGMGGIDYRPGKSFGIGPYLDASAGHYFVGSAGASFHGWLSIGVHVRTGQ